MKYRLSVHYMDCYYSYSFDDSLDFWRMELPNEFVIDIFKEHNHSYYFKAFFYNSKRIYSNIYCNSKYKLFGAIQKLLQEELYHVVQFP